MVASKKKSQNRRNNNRNASRGRVNEEKTNNANKLNHKSLPRETSRVLSKAFHEFLFRPDAENNSILVTKGVSVSFTMGRSELGQIFDDWLKGRPEATVSGARTQATVFSMMRQMRFLKSKRNKDGVICTLLQNNGRTSTVRTQDDYPTISLSPVMQPSPTEITMQKESTVAALTDKSETIIAPTMQHSSRQKMEENKHGMHVSPVEDNDMDLLIPPGQSHETALTVCNSNVKDVFCLKEVTIRGRNKKSFYIIPPTNDENTMESEITLTPNEDYQCRICIRPSRTGIYRASVWFHFQLENPEQDDVVQKSFYIVRFLKIRCGDPKLEQVLKPRSPYKRKERRGVNRAEDVVPPPKIGTDRVPSILHEVLPKHTIPLEVAEMITSGELEILINNELYQSFQRGEVETYTEFWQHLLWASEHQAKRDLTLFDIEQTTLHRQGIYYKLEVPGLAENRPSVLRGDIVKVVNSQDGKVYMARVAEVRQADVLLELASSFSKKYNPSFDRVEVRFTLSRTTFRTSHQGTKLAPEKLEKILFPHPIDPPELDSSSRIVSAKSELKWSNTELNMEQKSAVENIVRGAARPIPYVVYGPPGTGKSTTIVEAVYQLAKHPDGLKILVTAPSNDAADILLSKLSRFFPPSEMKRLLAYSRSIETVPGIVRPYCSEGRSEQSQRQTIMDANVRIVVSTVNLAARFSYFGIPRGHFNVFCVDEAGHATEPEIIGVLATLMDCESSSNKGQVVLAGDPKQLGPVVPSDLCQKFGMHISYMERLTLRKTYGRQSGEDNIYPPHLLTKLVQNYRSHPAIMKLPNEMFYDNELIMRGDPIATRSLAKWEYLPKAGFPLIFHSVHGENSREESSPPWFNVQEATVVIQYVKLLVQESKPAIAPKDIGIITPYNRQALKIRQALQTMEGLSTPGDIKVGSVETFQGQERRVIIVSTVRAETQQIASDLTYRLGFVKNGKRFNVALTRAAALLIVVGHPKVLATDEDNWLPFLRYCKENGAWTGEEWNEEGDNDEREMIATASEFDEAFVDKDSEAGDGDWFEIDSGDFISQSVEQGCAGLFNQEV